MKVYTKGGDKGMTTLFGGTKLSKSSDRVCMYGAVDEANAAIGLAAAVLENKAFADFLRLCQKKLLVIGAELASDERGKRLLKEHITEQDIQALEQVIDGIQEQLTPKSEFTVPGLSVQSATLHVARTQVRAAERQIVSLIDRYSISGNILIYMNRLSDFLFVVSRAVDEVDSLGSQ